LHIVNGGPWDEPSAREANGGEDGGGEGGGVDTSLKEYDVLAYTHDLLIPHLVPMGGQMENEEKLKKNEELAVMKKI
jgi:hypothetical protein